MPQIAVRSLRLCGWPQSLRLPLINPTQESDMAVSTDLFTKTVNIADLATVAKTINVAAFAVGNSAMASATADALGPFSHTETLTQTTAVQHVGSASASESLSVANSVFPVLVGGILTIL
jgi:hypothetical protein